METAAITSLEWSDIHAVLGQAHTAQPIVQRSRTARAASDRSAPHSCSTLTGLCDAVSLDGWSASGPISGNAKRSPCRTRSESGEALAARIAGRSLGPVSNDVAAHEALAVGEEERGCLSRSSAASMTAAGSDPSPVQDSDMLVLYFRA